MHKKQNDYRIRVTASSFAFFMTTVRNVATMRQTAEYSSRETTFERMDFLV